MTTRSLQASPVDQDKEPEWMPYARTHFRDLSWGEPLHLPEWSAGSPLCHDNNDTDDNNDQSHVYRRDQGWQGRDLLHDTQSPIRITHYFVRYGSGGPDCGLPFTSSSVRGGVGTLVTGLVHFTARAESHKGKCHGGGFCSVMDDVLAWCGMVVSGRCLPWSGVTVQVNTTLLASIPLDSRLVVQAWVTRIQKSRKIWVQARLFNPQTIETLQALSSSLSPSLLMEPTSLDPSTTKPWMAQSSHHGETVHAVGTGLVLLNKNVLPNDTDLMMNKPTRPGRIQSRL